MLHEVCHLGQGPIDDTELGKLASSLPSGSLPPGRGSCHISARGPMRSSQKCSARAVLRAAPCAKRRAQAALNGRRVRGDLVSAGLCGDLAEEDARRGQGRAPSRVASAPTAEVGRERSAGALGPTPTGPTASLARARRQVRADRRDCHTFQRFKLGEHHAGMLYLDACSQGRKRPRSLPRRTNVAAGEGAGKLEERLDFGLVRGRLFGHHRHQSPLRRILQRLLHAPDRVVRVDRVEGDFLRFFGDVLRQGRVLIDTICGISSRPLNLADFGRGSRGRPACGR